MAQLQVLTFTEAESRIATQFSLRGVRVIATPGSSDMFETFEGHLLTWNEIESRFPFVPMLWWQNLPENNPIAQAHLWLEAKGFIRDGVVSLGRLFVVKEHDLGLKSRPVATFLADAGPQATRNLLVHLDHFL
jgi:hypothetical protein